MIKCDEPNGVLFQECAFQTTRQAHPANCKPRKLILIYDIESNNPASPVSYLTLTLQTDTTPSLHNKPEQPSMHTNKSFN